MKRLQGKTALISGAAKGMGAAEARIFAEEGAQVIVADIDDAGASAVAKEIEDAGDARRRCIWMCLTPQAGKRPSQRDTRHSATSTCWSTMPVSFS